MYKLKVVMNCFIDYFYELKEFNELAAKDNQSDIKKRGKEICSVTQNMTSENWHLNKHSFLYRIYISQDFSDNKGALTLLYDDDKLISVSSVSRADFDSNVAITGRRSFVLKEYRGKMLFTNNHLAAHVKWAKKNKIKTVIFVINQDSVSVYKVAKRVSENKGSFSNKKPVLLTKFTEYPELLLIKGYYQHVFYYNLNNNEWSPPNEIRR
jgi:hypothetical protein